MNGVGELRVGPGGLSRDSWALGPVVLGPKLVPGADRL